MYKRQRWLHCCSLPFSDNRLRLSYAFSRCWPRLHTFTDYTAALRGVLLGVQLAQQKPPEQVKPLLQAALRGVYVSAGSYDLALHGIDNVEMRRVELLSLSLIHI